jgi:TPR repeat protein
LIFILFFFRAGLAEAQYNVGRCYREARGCMRSEEEAIYWFRKAEAQGIAEATKALAAAREKEATPKSSIEAKSEKASEEVKVEETPASTKKEEGTKDDGSLC